MWAYRRPAALASPSQTFDFLASHWKGAKILQSCWCLTLNSSKWKGKGVRTNLIPKYSWNCQNPQLSERNFFKNDDHQPSQQKSTAPTFVEKFPRVFFFETKFSSESLRKAPWFAPPLQKGSASKPRALERSFPSLGGQVGHNNE